MSTTPIGDVRDITASRSDTKVGSVSIVVMPDAANTAWSPVPGAVHTFATVAGARTLTITDASSRLAYDLKVGEGFHFWIQNEGANTITVARAGNVAAGAGTLTVATTTTRHFVLARTSATAYQLTTLGVASH